MHIAISVDPEIPVPPRHYGGIERVVAFLVENLCARGHQVTLFAHPDSRTTAQLVQWPGGNSLSPLDSLRNMTCLARHAITRQFDIIHSFSRVAYLLPLLPLPIPKLMTYQRAITPRSIRLGTQLSRGTLSYSTIGRHLLRDVEALGRWFVIPNGVPANLYQPSYSVATDAYLMFLGRIEEIKGAHLAIEVAKRTGRRLVLAGEPSSGVEHQRYFDERIRPHIDGQSIQHIGAVDDVQKNDWLGRAAALLMPVLWEEPFGIVMAEALACGTPVIGLNRGAVSEVVDDGITGFVCDGVEDMVAAVEKLPTIDRRRCRDAMEKRFSDTVIVDSYLQVYRTLLRG